MRPRSLAVVLVFAAMLIAPMSAAAAEFGIVPGSFSVTARNADGTIDAQASSHPYSYTVTFSLNADSKGKTIGELRDLLINLPPGFSGDPFAVERCTRQQFEGNTPDCPPNTQVGVIHVVLPELSGAVVSGPIYNVVPPPGVAAQLGFSASGLNALQNLSVRSAEGYGLRSTTNGIPLEVRFVEATIWGVPADPSHDSQRGAVAAKGGGGSVSYQGPRLPFLSLPASCAAPLETTIAVDSKADPGDFKTATTYSLDAGGNPAALSGCGVVPFDPSVYSTPTSSAGSSASGLDFEIKLPNEGLLNPEGIVETEPVKTEVTLPAGVTANPSAAAGLGACSEAQFASASATDPGCPANSKLGTLVARTPLLEEAVEGSVYLASPLTNRFGTLLSLYIVAAVPERGVVIKQAGRVDIDQATGQLTTTFDGLPPLPYSSFELKLREGPRAPLTMPLACGTYETTAKLYPFSVPDAATVRTAPFTISSGPEGGGCVASEAQLPNSPSFEAGTQTPLAGLYSPFVLKLSRGSGSQRFRTLNLTLPPGLAAKFAGRAECSDAQIAQAESRRNPGEGALEQQSPSCPAGSELGTVTVGAGSGSPLYVQGQAYLAGPYKGAPFSIVAITPAIAGPFDLGVVVVRSALYVNEETAQGTVKTDPIPTILQGIPLQVRSIAISIDNGDFTLNPTSCEASTVSGEAVSTSGQVAHLQNRFQVGGCNGLEFHPRLKLQLKGATKRAGHPKLKAVVSFPHKVEEANAASIQVGLPHALFLDQGNLNKVCTRPELASRSCPANSIYGHVKAYTPLFEEPLTGPVYLGVGFGYKLPALVTELNGKVRILAHGRVDTTKQKGLRNTFEFIPDAPISRIVLEMKGGKKYGLLENSENLCRKAQHANARFVAHNGKIAQLHPKITASCSKKKKSSKKKSK